LLTEKLSKENTTDLTNNNSYNICACAESSDAPAVLLNILVAQ